MAERHSLSDVDPASRNAKCSVCGPTKVYKNSTRWVCSEVSKNAVKRWKKANPQKVNAKANVRSAHHLTSKDVAARTGVCPVCGPVDIVPYGRGYACGVRARQLRTAQEEAPQVRCWKCRSWHSDANPVTAGVCTRCETELVPGRTLVGWQVASHPDTVEGRRMAAVYAELEECGLEITYPQDPYAVDDFEVVPGWKTIGSPLPAR